VPQGSVCFEIIFFVHLFFVVFLKKSKNAVKEIPIEERKRNKNATMKPFTCTKTIKLAHSKCM